MRGLETITVLVLLAFNFIPQRSHHSLTLPRSQFRDSATVTLTPGDGRKIGTKDRGTKDLTPGDGTKISVIGITDQLIPRCTGGIIKGPKHSPAALLHDVNQFTSSPVHNNV